MALFPPYCAWDKMFSKTTIWYIPSLIGDSLSTVPKLYFAFVLSSVPLFKKRWVPFDTYFQMLPAWRPKPNPTFTWPKHHTMRNPEMTANAQKRPHCSKEFGERVTGFHSSTLLLLLAQHLYHGHTGCNAICQEWFALSFPSTRQLRFIKP